MSTRSAPERPDLTPHQQAALARHLPHIDAQLATCEDYGFATWAELVQHVELVVRMTRMPHCVQPTDDPATEVMRLACLNYGVDDTERPRQAAALLAAHPEAVEGDLHCAVTANDLEATRRLLTAENANALGGPHAWPPLLYLVFSRLNAGPASTEIARLLLAAGADPNAGYLWDHLPSPFTALTGVFGGGEQFQLSHPEELVLGRLLLEAGADANDSQVLYNRGLGSLGHDDTALLELLLAHGLGQGDGGPWHRALTVTHQTPGEMLQDELMHAALRGLPRRTRLVLDHGADPNGTGQHSAYGTRTAYELALVNGHDEVAVLLHEAGGVADLSVGQLLVGRLLAGDSDALAAVSEDRIARAVARRPDLVRVAAETGRPAAVRLAVQVGFDVNHLGHSTALHEAALRGDRPVVDALLELGADRTIKDPSFDSDPAGWAEHAGNAELAAYLRG